MVKCEKARAAALDGAHILGRRDSKFDAELLVDNRPEVARPVPRHTDGSQATIDDIMIFFCQRSVRRMTGLMLKDMYSLRTYFLKQLALMTVLYLAISVGLMKNFSFLSPMLTMSVVMMLISSFSVDEASSWDSYALTLPRHAPGHRGREISAFLRCRWVSGRYRICPVRRAGQFYLPQRLS